MIHEKAPAKINLTLDVIGKREDGYHELNMVMTTVDLYDRLSISETDEDRIIITTNRRYLPVDNKNLSYKAAKLIKEQYGIKKGVRIHINKNIPVAAGLAGGSSDAAATLRGLDRLWKLNMSFEELSEIGARIGSDVPFCIYGKTALATGRGEIIKPIKPAPKCWVILVKPKFGVSTKHIFSNVEVNSLKHPDTKAMLDAVLNGDYKSMCKNLGNSLEDVTFKRYPDVKKIKEKLLKYGADAALMSGSGPTVFAFVYRENKKNRLINSLDQDKYQIFAVRMLG
ncbi:4-(cytidine 5'-diphospho)-2-C-methyl-D-erythritol kinase [Haloplasma contractile]|uniref:4-diphosphocytidyl-2-C-methyl-D-erythritol kinase n=1 Tax=Haloplasma contractile SSD-17B TaxID=1033810 RepID=U2FI24_9MOLU|nr:4-(cytidine 5'-diphospho)-2-C-methyl-D-erythritol kinase [Haloplasma contractile]ERJ12465.1 4-diphosphocytidyl-2-C-methyl-D-erythritol kinase protein [Haloplasma contractile SSD-17B]